MLDGLDSLKIFSIPITKTDQLKKFFEIPEEKFFGNKLSLFVGK